MTWCESERTRSRLFRAPNPALADPNCVDDDGANSWMSKSPWTRLLARRQHGSLHVDVHGRRDPDGAETSAQIGDGDCDLGFGALEALAPLRRLLRAQQRREPSASRRRSAVCVAEG